MQLATDTLISFIHEYIQQLNKETIYIQQDYRIRMIENIRHFTDYNSNINIKINRSE